MHKDREIRNAKGELIHFEKPGYGLMIKDGIIVNQESYNLFMERQKQNSVAPTSADPALVEKTKQEEAEILGGGKKRIDEIEKKVDAIGDTLSAILHKLDEKS